MQKNRITNKEWKWGQTERCNEFLLYSKTYVTKLRLSKNLVHIQHAHHIEWLLRVRYRNLNIKNKNWLHYMHIIVSALCIILNYCIKRMHRFQKISIRKGLSLLSRRKTMTDLGKLLLIKFVLAIINSPAHY